MLDAYYLDMFSRVLAICLVLTGIHGYLGIHVLARQVIFVDLAMAQIAALGATYALLLGYDPSRHPEDVLPSYLFSLAFTVAGAGVFALTRARHERIPQEATIGVVYATASAVVILMLAKSPTAGEQIKHMLVGNILLVDWPTVARTAAIYGVIGLFHWGCRKTFLRITLDPAAAAREGIRVRLWDFLFYATFGVVITSSVAIGGVLLVFSFLVVPAAVGMLFGDSTAARIGIAWCAGTAVSFIGVLYSFWTDVPAGPAVVASFGAVLALAGVLHFVGRAPSRLIAAGKVTAAVVLLAAAFQGMGFLRKPEEMHTHHSDFEALVEALAGDDETRQLEALHHLEEDPDPHLLPHVLRLLEVTTLDRVIEHAAHVVPLFKDRAAADVLLAVAQRDLDPFLRIELATAVLRCGVRDGIPMLLDVLGREEATVVRETALAALSTYTGRTFGYDPSASREDNARALAEWRVYWTERGAELRWRERLKRFE